ncbi:MAG: right-handed parallel beta-helix repeat-containing protein [Deltaproteobacteria bacterium]|nr:right-handed parallel beta-helix repeat-containing protein [Deltaproteobacteria bacterium]
MGRRHSQHQTTATSLGSLAVACALLAGAVPAGAATYYAAALSTACSPATPGTGTLASPYAHPYYALTQGQVSCGDVLQLRGGTYRAKLSGFSDDSTAAKRYSSCDDDQLASGGYDGGHTVLPLFKQCSAAAPLIIENFPGEDVVLEGADADLDAGSVWSPCSDGGDGPGGANDACCGAAGLSLAAPSETYCATGFNVSNSDTAQIWIDPPVDGPGQRLAWWADGPALLGSDAAADHDGLPRGGFFSVNSGNPLVVRLSDGSDPDSHRVKLVVQGGDGAYGVVAATGAAYMTVRRNPSGGSFRVKYGYHPLNVVGGSQHVTFDGVEVMGAGGHDYGNCLRTSSGTYIAFRNGLCRDAMAEGIAHYGGGPGAPAGASGVQLSHCTVENSTIFDTGRGWLDGGGKGTNLGMGVILKNCNDCIAAGNTIHDTFRDGISVTTSTEGCGGTCTSNNVVIDRNLIYNNCHAADQIAAYPPNPIGTGDCACIQLEEQGTGTMAGATISNNMCRGDYANPVLTVAAAGIKIDSTIPNVKIVNNAIRNTGGPCIDLSPNGAVATVRNNATDVCSRAGTPCSGFACNLYATTAAVPIHSNNTYWGASGATNVVRIIPGIAHTRDQVVGAFEASAKQLDPLFLSPTDLHLQAGSGLIGGATTTDAPPLDFDGDTRPAGVASDVGADVVSGRPGIPNLLSVTPIP